MKLTLETKLDIFKMAIQEDRMEVRLIKDQIYKTCTLITASSFGVTSFLLFNNKTPGLGANSTLLPIVDVSFIAVLWAIFSRLKIDLSTAHRAVEAREDMLQLVLTDESIPFDPFGKMDWSQPARIKENGLFWIVGTCTLTLLVKLAWVLWWQHVA